MIGEFFRERPIGDAPDPLAEARGILVGAVLGALAWLGPVLVWLLLRGGD